MTMRFCLNFLDYLVFSEDPGDNVTFSDLLTLPLLFTKVSIQGYPVNKALTVLVSSNYIQKRTEQKILNVSFTVLSLSFVLK